MATLVLWAVAAVGAPHAVTRAWVSKPAPHVTFSSQYPQISGALPAVNQRLKAVAMPEAEEIKDAVSDQDAQSFDESVECRVGLLTDRCISVEYSGLGVRTPSAHPEKIYRSVTLDLRTGRDITLAGLFRPATDYQNRIKNLALQQLGSQLKGVGQEALDAEAFTDGIHFYLKPHRLVIFNIYNAFAMQDLTTSIDSALLHDMLRPGGPLE
ncbi:MAG TPA: hypothetical protein VGO93_03235 [Candidatus Xenobia bacterium]